MILELGFKEIPHQNLQVQVVDELQLWNRVRGKIAQIPEESKQLMANLNWGSPYQVFTPAFWKLQYLMNDFPEGINAHRISKTIFEEIILCILGGYGIPSEMGMLAYERLQEEDLLIVGVSFAVLNEALSRPFELPTGKSVHYRFPNQKAKYIASFFNRSDLNEIPLREDIALRGWLVTVNGIGPKTASWITRNWLRSEQVAILDVHLLRAGVLTGFFDKLYNIEADYYKLEKRFLDFCKHMEVKPSDLDAIIWSYMKKNNRLALNTLSSV